MDKGADVGPKIRSITAMSWFEKMYASDLSSPHLKSWQTSQITTDEFIDVLIGTVPRQIASRDPPADQSIQAPESTSHVCVRTHAPF